MKILFYRFLLLAGSLSFFSHLASASSLLSRMVLTDCTIIESSFKNFRDAKLIGTAGGGAPFDDSNLYLASILNSAQMRFEKDNQKLVIWPYSNFDTTIDSETWLSAVPDMKDGAEFYTSLNVYRIDLVAKTYFDVHVIKTRGNRGRGILQSAETHLIRCLSTVDKSEP